MDNPLEQPAPEDPIARVEAYARDLAWGVAHGYWGTGLAAMRKPGNHFERMFSPANIIDISRRDNLREKWGEDPPGTDLMLSFGYADAVDPNRSGINFSFVLSPKAIRLLEKPDIQHKIFVSYKQSESSAFAMLVEARLKYFNPEIDIFMDKSIKGGERWPSRIQNAIEECDYFICIFGPETPKSKGVRDELNLALKCNKQILLLTHRGYKELPNGLSEIQRCAEILKENADGYETAILKLFSDLGYPTLQSPRPPATVG